MGSKKGNVKIRRKGGRPQIIVRLAPQAGFEPATLRLTGSCRLSILLVLRAFSSDGNLLLPGVREQIVHGLFTALCSHASVHDRVQILSSQPDSQEAFVTSRSSREVTSFRQIVPCRPRGISQDDRQCGAASGQTTAHSSTAAKRCMSTRSCQMAMALKPTLERSFDRLVRAPHRGAADEITRPRMARGQG